MLFSIGRDIRSAARGWLRNPGIALAAIGTLTIGIAATTTIFSVLNSLVFRPLPVLDAPRLLRVSGQARNGQAAQMSMPDALDLKARLHSISGFAFYRRRVRNLADQSKPFMVHVLEGDADLFRVMGLRMTQGHGFTPSANQPGHQCEVVISWPFWESRFSGSNVTGRTIRLNESPCLIDGVLPRDLDFPVQSEIWVPATFDLQKVENGRQIDSWYAFTRLKKDVSLSSFNAELNALTKELRQENPIEDGGVRFKAMPLREWLADDAQRSVLILFGAVVGVLLMACANVAHLLLARASARMREVGVRLAVGANRRNLFQQLLIESVLLALTALLSGLVVTAFAVRFIANFPDSSIPRPESVVIDWRVMLFALLVSTLTGILFGTLPAFRLLTVSLTGILKQTSGRITESSRQQTTRKILVATETALAVVLLIASFLLARSFREVMKVNLGFDTTHLLTAYLSLPIEHYGKDTMDLDRLAKNAVSRLQNTPGIQGATVTTNVPLQNSDASAPVQIEGQPPPQYERDAIPVLETDVSPGFRRTLQIPLLTGHDLEERDDRETASSILVNATFARTFFPGRNAVGRRIRYNPTVNPSGPWQTIIGVVGDTLQDGMEKGVAPEVYIPLARGTSPFPAVIIRTEDEPAAHLHDIEKAVHAVDAGIPVYSARTMEQVEARSLGSRTFDTALIGGFALMALLLASVGIFAVISYSVSQRTSEIGVRMACGATQENIVGLIIRQGVIPAAIGILVGSFASYFLMRFLQSLLFGVKPTDLASYVGAISLLMSVAVAASVIPALRAARINPWEALRYE